MIAPRKKLWSTPGPAIEAALQLLNLQQDDIVFDVGAGDGRFLKACLQTSPVGHAVGVEIDEDRANQAIADLLQMELDPSRYQMLIKNALDVDYSSATAFFLYLIPRGLRLILPIIKQQCKNSVRIVTYMSPLPEETPVSVVKVNTSSHLEAEWPLFYYELPGNLIPSGQDVEPSSRESLGTADT